MRMTVKTSGYAIGTVVRVSFNLTGDRMLGTLVKHGRGYAVQGAKGDTLASWGSARKVYFGNVGYRDRDNFAIEAAAPTDVQAAKQDLADRALSLGYTDESAWELADCFTNWDMISDPCVKHPNHSMTTHKGYAVDGCVACEVIKLSDLAGYVAACICDEIMAAGASKLPAGGRACPCGSIFTVEGTDASDAVVAQSEVAIAAKLARMHGPIDKAAVLTSKPIDSLLNSGAATVLDAEHVVRRTDVTRVGKIVGVYGPRSTATKVRVAWGEDADTTSHYAITDAVDELISDLIPAPVKVSTPVELQEALSLGGAAVLTFRVGSTNPKRVRSGEYRPGGDVARKSLHNDHLSGGAL